MTRNIGQKFCLFDDLKGETPSVLKEGDVQWVVLTKFTRDQAA